jgi:subtilisin family serine protease/PKD repeat protein
MGRSTNWLVTALAFGGALMTGVSSGTPPRARSAGSVLSAGARFGTVVASAAAHDRRDVGFPRLADGRVAAMVELDREPAATTWGRAMREASAASPGVARAAAIAATRTDLAAVEQDQRSLVPMLVSPDIGATLLFRVARAYDGVAIEVDPAQLALLRELPGVRAVHPLPLVRVDNFSSVPLIAAPAAWDPAGPNVRGDGVRIGIIDTGIDYIHRDFGGSGNYTGLIPDDDIVPWTAKVVGGWDFAGDAYDASGTDASATTPHPDPDPMDCFGHGTHVAGTAAGYGVTAAGATYAGPWGPTTDFGALRIGPGVAPGAQLYALKVFGCSGTTALTIEAIDWAIDPNQDGDFSDRLDVINMSLGSPYGEPDDPLVAAANNAASVGILVACSAGNSGDSTYIVGSPAAAARAITAASSVDSTGVFGGFVVTTPATVAGNYPSQEGAFGPKLSLTGDVSAALAYPSQDRDACIPFASAQATELSGRVALVDRGTCTFESKVRNCQDVGAVGVIVANNVAGDPLIMAPDPSLNAVISIPSVFTTLQSGATLEAATATGTVSVTLTASLDGRVRIVDEGRVDTLSDFSSRGPTLGGSVLKPDVSTPGETIFSAALRTGDDGISFSGTSMASPHVAGAAALLRELHPGWSVEEIKAALMDTAWHDLYVGDDRTPPRYSPARIGAGRVDLAAASHTDVLAFAADGSGAVGLTFGAPEVIGHLAVDQNLRVEDKGDVARTFLLGFDAVASVPGVSVSFPDGAAVSVPGGGAATVRVRLEADAAALRHVRDASESATQLGQARAWLAEESGFVTLTPDPAPASIAGWGGTLRVPLWAAPRPTSVMTAAEGQVVLDASGAGTVQLTGQGVDTGDAPPVDVTSLAMPFELAATSPDARFSLAYVGVASDAPARIAAGGSFSDAIVEFAVAARSPFASPNETAFRVAIDTNQDGVADYVLSSSSYGDVSGSGSDDAFVSLLCPAHGASACTWMPIGGFSPAERDIAPFDTDVIVLPVPVAALHLVPGASRFDYIVTTGSGGEFDTSGTLTFDPAAPGLRFGAAPFPSAFTDVEGTAIPVVRDPVGYALDNAQGMLLLHLHNGAGRHAEALEVVTSGCSPTCTASVPGTAVAGSSVPVAAAVDAGGCGGDIVVDWDFGDASPHGTTASTSHTFAAPGSYAWRFTATAGSATCQRTGVITVSAPPAYHGVVGGVAHNPGSGGSIWRTGVVLVNRAAEPSTVTATFHGVDRTLAKSLTLPGGGAAGWSDVLEQLFGVGTGEDTQGALSLDADHPLAVSARTYDRSASGTYGQALPALTGGALATGQLGLIAGLAKDASFRSNVGVVNLGSAGCSSTVRLVDASGSPLGSAVTIVAGPDGWAQINDVFAAASAPSAELAYALVTPQSTGCSIWAYGSLVDNGTDDPTTVEAVQVPTAGPSGSGDVARVGAAATVTSAVIPAVAHNPGASGSEWRTRVALVGAFGSPAATVTLTYVPTAGQSLTRTASVPSFHIVAWQDVLADLFGVASDADTQGRIEIASDLPLVVSARTYDIGPKGTLGQAMPAVAAGDGVVSGSPGVLPQLVRNAAYRTNLGLVNLGPDPCDVRVAFFGPDGTELGTALVLHLAGGEWRPVNDALAAAGVTTADVAYGTVEALTDGGRIWGYASVVDNASNDPTTVPLEP